MSVGVVVESKPRLSRSQWRFIQEYMIDLNATAAAGRAGYTPAHADVLGSRLLNNPKVKAVIDRLVADRAIRVEITQQRVLRELALLAFSDVNHYEQDENGKLRLTPGAPKSAMRAVSSVKYKTTTDAEGKVTHETELKLWDKPGPLKLAGKHVGLFADKVEVTGKDGGAIAIEHSVSKLTDAELQARIAETVLSSPGLRDAVLGAMQGSQIGPIIEAESVEPADVGPDVPRGDGE